ncbi:hypothetical protein [Actinoplanes derwentensis]|uniref:Uncharacterized protein n=1 Tax=Actinoplanes derwentensis TaxID=113562 RepID=A0A1H1YF26_9ACTN|nr:hypothetical protein [Actinoplanes derwentensis]GID81113.1 hypothetical protein Ade03nite_00370 [Actinoplanes derwentensis]SDT19859.1 hypothetical protein SAMN04489716_2822 [Actinoplanes derwentensis]
MSGPGSPRPPARPDTSWSTWWAIHGTPRFFNGQESYFPGGWVPVALGVLALAGCSVAAVVAGRAVHDKVRYVLAAFTAVAGAALWVYSFLFPVIVVALLFEGAGPGMVASLLATGAGVGGGLLCLLVAAAERRRAARPCEACGRVHGRSPESREARAPGWAFAGAYLAVAGFVARMSVWLADTLAGRWPSAASDISWTALTVFMVLMTLAGTLLPLALAHRWGRLWPAWVWPVRGRAVPRWLVLGTGLFVGTSLTAYFGIAGMTAWIRGSFGGAFLPLLLEMGGYTLWGAGLLVASASYYAMTRPPCPRTVPQRVSLPL